MDSKKVGQEAHDRHDVSKDEKGNKNLKWHLEHMKTPAAGLMPKSILIRREKTSMR